jgi:hypothetical protein
LEIIGLENCDTVVVIYTFVEIFNISAWDINSKIWKKKINKPKEELERILQHPDID